MRKIRQKSYKVGLFVLPDEPSFANCLSSRFSFACAIQTYKNLHKMHAKMPPARLQKSAMGIAHPRRFTRVWEK